MAKRMLIVGLALLAGCIMPKELRWQARVYEDIERVYEDIEKGMYEKALEKVERFERENPDLPWWFSMQISLAKADIFEAQKKIEEAIGVLEEFLENPYYPGYIHNKLARLYLKKGRIEDAKKRFEVMRKIEEMNLRMDIAQSYEEARLLEEAERLYTELREEFPEYYRIYTRLGTCYRKMGNVERALSNYEKALELYFDIEAVMWGGGILALMGKKERAISYFEKASSAFQYHKEDAKIAKAILQYMGSPSYEKAVEAIDDVKDLNKAIQAVEERLKEEPDSLHLSFVRVVLCALLERDGLEDAVDRVIELAPRSKEAEIAKMLR